MIERISRRKTRVIQVGNVKIGGDNPISVQSMTNTETKNIDETVRQIERLEEAGCEIVRVAVPDMKSALSLSDIKKNIKIPLIADIHFDYRLALKSMERGADGLRINPGNIGSKNKIIRVVDAAKDYKIPIRIGINSGSLEKDILDKYGHPTPEAMGESALRHITILEDNGFEDIKLSLKASDVIRTVEAYRLISKLVDYPLHIGITEAGTIFSGTVKSSVGLGILLMEGIGDTLRVSLTSDPVDEVKAGYEILKSLKLRTHGINIISCPICARCEIDLIGLVNKVEEKTSHIKTPMDVSIMGCVVNGPGEAKEADIGLAGAKGNGIIFKKGKVVCKVPEEKILDIFIAEIEKMAAEKEEERNKI